MTLALIGLVALVASVSSWFPPGIGVGAALIALGVSLSFAGRTHA